MNCCDQRGGTVISNGDWEGCKIGKLGQAEACFKRDAVKLSAHSLTARAPTPLTRDERTNTTAAVN